MLSLLLAALAPHHGHLIAVISRTGMGGVLCHTAHQGAAQTAESQGGHHDHS